MRQTETKILCQEVRSTRRSRVRKMQDFSLHLVIQTYICIYYLLILLDADYNNQQKEMI